MVMKRTKRCIQLIIHADYHMSWFEAKVKALHKSLNLLLVLVVVTSSLQSSVFAHVPMASTDLGTYYYKFVVSEDGFAKISIIYESSSADGSSWVFIPRFLQWDSVVLAGRVLWSEIIEPEDVVGVKYYFFQVFRFRFESNTSFKICIRFEMDNGALIIEQCGIFFSPQIGFQNGSKGMAEVFLPEKSSVVQSLAIGRRGDYRPDNETGNHVSFCLNENLLRLQVEFRTGAEAPELVTLKEKVFTFESAKKYESYARDILCLFDTVYDEYVDLFNVTLGEISTRFFLPEFSELRQLGGYVPFTGRNMGDVHINIFFVRSIKGVIEVIALHELVHHFLWRKGFSPDDFLWFHEGLAQYISIETAKKIGYEGASSERTRLEGASQQLIRTTGEDFGFLQQWKTGKKLSDLGNYYAASYYIANCLAEKFGGLSYYKAFFDLVGGQTVKDNNLLIYYLSLAAKIPVAPMLTKWGFDVFDLYGSSPLADEAAKAVYGLGSLFQPYKFMAEHLYKQGLLHLEKSELDDANRYFEGATLVARSAPIFTAITFATITFVVLYTLRKRFRSFQLEHYRGCFSWP